VKRNKTHIDDLFRDKLGNYSEVPPSDAWQDLDTKLDTLTPHVPTAPLRWVTHVGMVSLIAVLSVSFVQQYFGNHETAADVADMQQANTELNKADNVATAANATNNMTDAANGNETTNSTESGSRVANNAISASMPVAATATHDADGSAVTGDVVVAKSNKVGSSYAEMEYGDDVSFSPNADKEYINDGSRNFENENINEEGTDKAIAVNNHKSSLNQYNNTTPLTVAAGNDSDDDKMVLNAARAEIADKTDEVAQTKNIENQLVAGNSNGNAAAEEVKEELTTNTTIKPKATIPTKEKTPKPPRNYARWEAGVKSGYERGFDNLGSTKFAVAPYLQYNVTGKVAIMTQPAVKFANAPMRNIGNPQQYYNVVDNGKVSAVESFTTVKVEGGSVQEYNNTRYNYTRSHDSIVKSNTTGGRYMEYELPVLMKYSLSKKSSVYGGVNVVYSQLQHVRENTYTVSGIVRSVDTLITAIGEPIAPPINDILTHDGTPISDYNGPLYPVSSKQNVRMGAMLGFTYQYSSRLMLDALVQKNPAPVQSYNGYNINAPLSSTSFRISVGYKITK